MIATKAFTAWNLRDECVRRDELHRWYDATTGTWISQDPIGFEAGDANLYRYVGNGPSNGVDPSGLERDFGACIPQIGVCIGGPVPPQSFRPVDPWGLFNVDSYTSKYERGNDDAFESHPTADIFVTLKLTGPTSAPGTWVNPTTISLKYRAVAKNIEQDQKYLTTGKAAIQLTYDGRGVAMVYNGSQSTLRPYDSTGKPVDVSDPTYTPRNGDYLEGEIVLGKLEAGCFDESFTASVKLLNLGRTTPVHEQTIDVVVEKFNGAVTVAQADITHHRAATMQLVTDGMLRR